MIKEVSTIWQSTTLFTYRVIKLFASEKKKLPTTNFTLPPLQRPHDDCSSGLSTHCAILLSWDRQLSCHQLTQQKKEEKPLFTAPPRELPQLHLKSCQAGARLPLRHPHSLSAPQFSAFPSSSKHLFRWFCPSKAIYTKGPVTKQQGSKGYAFFFFPLERKKGTGGKNSFKFEIMDVPKI